MSARVILIAGQAGIVAILIAVAYFVFLKGEDSGPLSEIDAPGGSRVQVDEPKRSDGQKTSEGNRGGGQGRNGDARRRGGVGAGVLVASPSSARAARRGSDRTPADDQYSDAVSVLKSKLEPGGETVSGP